MFQLINLNLKKYLGLEHPGDAPELETINNPSPKPNKVRPSIKKNTEDNLGFKLSGFFELHDTIGIFFILKNILMMVFTTS